MAELNINGRMSVKNLKKQFKEAFGASLRVYNGKELADDDARLASIRTGDAKGGDLSVRGNMKVGGFEKKMLEIYGISVQVADAADTQLVPDDVTIASVARFQSGESTGNSGTQVENEASVAAPAAVPAVDIERLIDAALMDGVVTDKERAILIKKATAQGIDPDEFEMVLDAKILEKGAQSAPAASSTPDAAPAVEAAAVAVAAEKAAEEAKAKAETEAKAKAEAEVKAKAEAEAKAKAEAETKAKAEAEAKAKAEAEAKAKAEAEAKAKAEAEAKAKAEAEAKAKAEAEAKAKKNTKAIAVKANDEGKYMGVATTGQTLYFVPDANDANSVIATSPYEGMWDEEPEGDIALPDKVNLDGKVMSVIGVGKAAFFACKQITSITLPESITSIGENAFKECIKLTKVVASGVTAIGANAFQECSKLVSVEFLMVVGIESSAFKGCSNLADVQCPEAEKIGSDAFRDLEKLANAQFPKLKSLGECAFRNCKLLEQFTISNGVTIIPKEAFYGSGLKKIIIPNSVTEIGFQAFRYSKLEKVIIPSSVLKIGKYAFRETKLTSVILPNKQVKFQMYDKLYNDGGDWCSDYSKAFSCSVTI